MACKGLQSARARVNNWPGHVSPKLLTAKVLEITMKRDMQRKKKDTHFYLEKQHFFLWKISALNHGAQSETLDPEFGDLILTQY